MHRAILIAWLPWLVCLLAAAAALWLVLRLSGARLEVAKLRRLHRCESGNVQTLSFVLTLPLFILLVLFIVQMTELMVGIAVVHYAAFAAARSAAVWLPAEVPASGELANNVYYGTMRVDSADADAQYPHWRSALRDNSNGEWDALWKYSKISGAAMLACVPIAPTRGYYDGDDQPSEARALLARALAAVSPTVKGFPNFERIVRRKCNYAFANTRIDIQGIDANRDALQGPTYNPYPGHFVKQSDESGNMVDVWVPWNSHEVGWEDPVTVTVYHYLALLPGPGRFLAKQLSPADGTPDQVSGLIVSPGDIQGFGFVNANKYKDKLKAVPLQASVTISNEGLKSVLPYGQPRD